MMSSRSIGSRMFSATAPAVTTLKATSTSNSTMTARRPRMEASTTTTTTTTEGTTEATEKAEKAEKTEATKEVAAPSMTMTTKTTTTMTTTEHKTPKAALHDAYVRSSAFRGKSIATSFRDVSHVSQNGRTWWTSTFQCPVTGRIYQTTATVMTSMTSTSMTSTWTMNGLPKPFHDQDDDQDDLDGETEQEEKQRGFNDKDADKDTDGKVDHEDGIQRTRILDALPEDVYGPHMVLDDVIYYQRIKSAQHAVADRILKDMPDLTTKTTTTTTTKTTTSTSAVDRHRGRNGRHHDNFDPSSTNAKTEDDGETDDEEESDDDDEQETDEEESDDEESGTDDGNDDGNGQEQDDKAVNLTNSSKRGKVKGIHRDQVFEDSTSSDDEDDENDEQQQRQQQDDDEDDDDDDDNNENDEEDPNGNGRGKKPRPKDQTSLKHLSPKMALHNHFTRQHKINVSTDESFVLTHKTRTIDSTEWWTATFTCPITQQVHHSGSLKDEDRFGQVRYLDPPNSTGKGIGGAAAAGARKVFYPLPKSALHAAAATYLDHFAAQQQEEKAKKDHDETEAGEDATAGNGTGTEDPPSPIDDRLCWEDPTGTSPFVHPHLRDRLLNDSPSVVRIRKPLSWGLGYYGDEDEKADDLSSAERDHHDHNDDDEAGYLVEKLPSAGSTTLDRVLRAWADNVAQPAAPPVPPPHVVTNSTNPSSPVRSTRNVKKTTGGAAAAATQNRNRMLREAHSWFRAMKPQDTLSSPRRRGFDLRYSRNYIPSGSALTIGNSILHVLAKANELSPNRPNSSSMAGHASQSPPNDVEHLATQVLDFMQSSGDGSVDAETYSAYIRCLSSSTAQPAEVAQRAERMLMNMAQSMPEKPPQQQKQKQQHQHQDGGDGDPLSTPTVTTYNDVVAIWANVGGTEGREESERVFDMFQDHNVKPNRGSFLALLSSMTRPDQDGRAHFSFDKAREWIERMERELASPPDLEAMNAPMPWTPPGATPWEKYQDWLQLDRAVTPRRDTASSRKELLSQAEELERWFHYAAERGLVNAQSYEAVMQAWIQTRSREGAEKAESWGLKLLSEASTENDDTNAVKLTKKETFYPVLAALAYNGKVHELRQWLKRISNLSPSHDCLLEGSLITAWRFQQQQQQQAWMGRKNTNGENATDEEARLVAENCLDHLRSMCEGTLERHEGREKPYLLESWLFSHTIRACAVPGDGRSIPRILGTLQLLSRTIGELVDLAGQGGRADDDAESLRRQLGHLLHTSPSIYISAIRCLNRSSNFPGIAAHSSLIEAILRSIREQRALMRDLGMEHPRAFLPRRAGSGMSHSTPPLYLCKEILEGLRSHASGHDTDRVHLALLVFGTLLKETSRNSRLISSFSNDEWESAALPLYRIVVDILLTIPNQPERRAILTCALRNVQDSKSNHLPPPLRSAVIEVFRDAITKSASLPGPFPS